MLWPREEALPLRGILWHPSVLVWGNLSFLFTGGFYDYSAVCKQSSNSKIDFDPLERQKDSLLQNLGEVTQDHVGPDCRHVLTLTTHKARFHTFCVSPPLVLPTSPSGRWYLSLSQMASLCLERSYSLSIVPQQVSALLRPPRFLFAFEIRLAMQLRLSPNSLYSPGWPRPQDSPTLVS